MNILANIIGCGSSMSEARQLADAFRSRVVAAGGEIVSPACLETRINNLLNKELVIQAFIERVENAGGEIVNQACLSSRYIALTEINLS